MLLVPNKKAHFEHEVLSKYTAGVALQGYEVKAIKEKKVSFDGSFVQVIKDEAILLNLYIGPYSKQSQDVAEVQLRRSRKLLLKKDEIYRVEKDLHEKGRTAIPLAFTLEHNLVKLEFAVVRGKKKEEKKHIEKEKQMKKDLEREAKYIRVGKPIE